MKEQTSYSIALRCILTALLLVLLCSCISFDIGDWPSSYVYPHNDPVENWCGSAGAFCSYYLFYYLGPGVFVLLTAAGIYLVAGLADYSFSQPVFRAVGVLLLTVAVSSTYYSIWPEQIYSFPTGSGGVIGTSVTVFLKSHLGLLGTFILLSSLWIVGLILVADDMVLSALAWTGNSLCAVTGAVRPAWSMARERSEVLTEIWHRLSIRQKDSPQETERPEAEPSLPLSRDKKVEEKVQRKKRRKKKKLQVVKAAAAEEKPSMEYVPMEYDDYTLPPLDLLEEPEYGYAVVQEKVVKEKAASLEKLLGEFNIEAEVVAAETGPVITMFELDIAAGVKVSQINSLANDMARALGAGAVRVVAPLPGRHTIGIEVPNSEKEKVRMKDLIQLAPDKPRNMVLPLFLGKDSSGDALVADLASMPHLLIAGTTGSGKSVCINSIIGSILMTRRPDEVKLIIIDPDRKSTRLNSSHYRTSRMPSSA